MTKTLQPDWTCRRRGQKDTVCACYDVALNDRHTLHQRQRFYVGQVRTNGVAVEATVCEDDRPWGGTGTQRQGRCQDLKLGSPPAGAA